MFKLTTRQNNLDKFYKTVAWIIINFLVTSIIAVVQNWKLADVLLLYWAQLILEGYFHFDRIKNLKNFTTKQFNKQRLKLYSKRDIKVDAAIKFLATHVVTFTTLFVVFVYSNNNLSFQGSNAYLMIIIFLSYYLSYDARYKTYKKQDSIKTVNLDNLQWIPLIGNLLMLQVVGSLAVIVIFFDDVLMIIIFLAVTALTELVMILYKQKIYE